MTRRAWVRRAWVRRAWGLTALAAGLVGCHAVWRPDAPAEAAVIEAALRTVPVREVDTRVVVGEGLRERTGMSPALLATLRTRLEFMRWFDTEAAATAYCASLAEMARCVRLQVQPVSRRGNLSLVPISRSMVGGCGFQVYEVAVVATGDQVVVRSVSIGESGSCAPPPPTSRRLRVGADDEPLPP